MARKNIAEHVAGKRVRLVTAHPDDSIWYAALISRSAYADEALLTAGERGKSDDRLAEEKAAAAILNLKQMILYPGRDGHLEDDADKLVWPVAKGAIKHRIDILAGNALMDHPDHEAAGTIATKAARLASRLGHPMGVLLIHHYDEGEYWTEATPDSMERTFLAAKQHGSQWRTEDGVHQDWPIVPGGFSMYPDDLASLQPYPLLRDASFTHVRAEQLIMPTAHDVIRYTNA